MGAKLGTFENTKQYRGAWIRALLCILTPFTNALEELIVRSFQGHSTPTISDQAHRRFALRLLAVCNSFSLFEFPGEIEEEKMALFL